MGLRVLTQTGIVAGRLGVTKERLPPPDMKSREAESQAVSNPLGKAAEKKMGC